MSSLSRLTLLLAALNGFMAVAAGAFGAHGVDDLQVKAWLQTGAAHQLAHAVAGLACVAVAGSVRPARWAGILFGAGGLVFGASLYALALTGVRSYGAVTPVGGVLLLAGWAVLAFGAMRASRI